ncbi:ATP-binding cassette sub-family A member 3 [Trichonephila inaurata madagascariensis]|uniref:ATP-binding cassette sub-family A member 3 n=1 Tax=Trichonephila inaurata madagascariensis TaxID=2747483 RepID=A0A8X6Y2M7_9ARAC|nr:ATP-binding cassette sub-family A member 3 [Trichonephila inaurata madagascariensis]
MGEFKHIILLMWKNFKRKLYHPLIIVIEICIPCLLLAELFICHDCSYTKSNISETIYQPYNINYIPNNNGTSEEILVFYSPKSPLLDKVMNDAARKLNFIPLGCDTESKMVKMYENSTSNVIAGIVFDNHLTERLKTTKIIEFKIRSETIPGYFLNIDGLFPKVPVLGPLNKNSIWGTDYMTLGFLPLQHAVSMSLMNNLFPNSSKNIDDLYTVYMQRFPEPPYVQRDFRFKPKFIFIIFICLGYLLPIANLTKNVVHEKEKRLKEVFKVMGVANWMNLTAWYLTEMAAMSCIFIGFFLTVMPFMHLLRTTHKISTFALIILCLFPNTILGYSLRTIIQLEEMGLGLQWKNINFIGFSSLGLSMKNVLFIFMGDTIIFFLCAWYIEAVFPGKMSEGQPWYFLFTSVFWTGHKSPQTEVIESFGLHELKPEFFEKEPYGIRPFIEFKYLTKIFKKINRPTIKKLYLKAYRNQITVLLGHDGTGKSTVISMLLGQYYPTSGNVFIKGCNLSIESEARKIPRFLGFCPNYDVYFDHFNVEENLYFFCKMKGFESEGVQSQIDRILEMLDLELKRKTSAGVLSDSWKRKLSVGIALIGESEIVVMDDPTNRMDPYSRRIVWEALKTEKAFRTIFISTSHVEEAEAIGDRIGILDDGELQSFGSASFVKKIYGAGYHLIIEKEESCRVIDVTRLIKYHVSSARIYHSNNTLKYILPHDESPMFQFLFSELEEKKEALKITDFVLSQITMKNLFDKVSLKASSSYAISDFKTEMFGNETFDNTGVDEDNQNLLLVKERNKALSLYIQQAVAILKKQFKFSIRHPLLFLTQLLILFFGSIVSNALVEKGIVYDTPLQLNLSLYNVSGTPIEVQYSVNPSNKLGRDLSDVFASLFDHRNKPFLLDLREETLNEHLLEFAEQDPFDYFKNYFMAVDFSNDSKSSIITAYYNNKAFHSPALSLLYVHNTILKYITKDNDLHSLKVINHPFPTKYPKMAMIDRVKSLLPTFLVAQDVMFCISIVMAGFIVPLVIEKSSYFKQLQFISGLSRIFYWILSFLYDFGIYMLACILFLIVLANTGLYGGSYGVQLEKCGINCYEWEGNFFSWREPGIGKQVKQKTSDEQIAESSSGPILSSNQCLEVKELSKYFASKCAIDNLTFNVSRGESFGLIGIAESGKTTVVNIITGELSVSQGKVYIDGKDIVKLPIRAQEKIGLCPQYNPLLNSLTGEETLLFFANLNGIPKQKIQDCINYLSKILCLEDHLKQKVNTCNTIQKRKLSVAISLIGTPPLIILDEPTTKMDPISCRHVWNALLQASNLGCTVLLASQRMDACEILCSRIGMLVSGKLVYTGNLSDLKQQYSKGYTLYIKISTESHLHRLIISRDFTAEAKMWVEEIFPDAVLKAALPSSLYYYIPNGNIKWSLFFRTMAKAKRQKIIDDYSICETTLDQILFFVSSESTVKEKMITEYLKERMK